MSRGRGRQSVQQERAEDKTSPKTTREEELGQGLSRRIGMRKRLQKER